MADQIGRARGSSAADRDLNEARGLLNYPPDKWYVSAACLDRQFGTQYLRAMVELNNYNTRLAAGTRRVRATCRQPDQHAGPHRQGSGRRVERHRPGRSISYSGDWIDLKADDVFYHNKGLLYANALVLRDLGADFEEVLGERGADTIWQRMVDSMVGAPSLQPLIVVNGAPNAMVEPNHLAAQGFYLLRARTQLEEVIDILQK